MFLLNNTDLTMYVMWRWQLCIFRIRFRIDTVDLLSPFARVENQATRRAGKAVLFFKSPLYHCVTHMSRTPNNEQPWALTGTCKFMFLARTVANGLHTDSRLNCTFRLPIQVILDPGILPDVLHLYLRKKWQLRHLM